MFDKRMKLANILLWFLLGIETHFPLLVSALESPKVWVGTRAKVQANETSQESSTSGSGGILSLSSTESTDSDLDNNQPKNDGNGILSSITKDYGEDSYMIKRDGSRELLDGSKVSKVLGKTSQKSSICLLSLSMKYELMCIMLCLKKIMSFSDIKLLATFIHWIGSTVSRAGQSSGIYH